MIQVQTIKPEIMVSKPNYYNNKIICQLQKKIRQKLEKNNGLQINYNNKNATISKSR